jgi:hypothetical protein
MGEEQGEKVGPGSMIAGGGWRRRAGGFAGWGANKPPPKTAAGIVLQTSSTQL